MRGATSRCCKPGVETLRRTGQYRPVPNRSSVVVRSALLLGISIAIISGCGGDDKNETADVTEACNRLDDLAGVVLSVGSATTAQEVEAAIAAPLAAFITASDKSGDDLLAELAHTYDSKFSTYLQGGSDAAGAGEDANVALDRAGARCSELGATNVFPTAP
jgi:hypothetical protein